MFTPTGFYGPFTVRAIAEFQRRTGVTGPDADGTIVGSRTNAALWAEGYRGRT
jgi:peptidoglycan hydrolase-like protein with peptidoglycan-binding domain